MIIQLLLYNTIDKESSAAPEKCEFDELWSGGWFKAFLQYSFYQVVANAFVFIFAKLLAFFAIDAGGMTIEQWMTAPTQDALKLQRPLPDGTLKIVMTGEKEDPAP